MYIFSIAVVHHPRHRVRHSSPIHTSHSHTPITPLVHTCSSQRLLSGSQIHTSSSHLPFTPLLHTCSSQRLLSGSQIHTSSSQLPFTPLLHTCSSQRLSSRLPRAWRARPPNAKRWRICATICWRRSRRRG